MKNDRDRSNRDPSDSPCTIPPRVPDVVLRQSVIMRPEDEERAVREYVESQSPDERVTHLEKVATEHLFDRRLDAWDVHTTGERYWVITSPTNLYSQELFPSLDYTISFHVGVTTRVAARSREAASDEEQDRLASAWRRWNQATEALDRADEAEEFQAVGMRCRECLLALIRAIADPSMVPENTEEPKAADFLRWSKVIAGHIAGGSRAKELRAYLKSVAKTTWQLVNWLTHATNAIRFDATMAVEATQSTLCAFGAALVRYETNPPDRCPRCGSYRIATTYRPDLEIDPPYVNKCESCGWFEEKGKVITGAA